MKTSFLFWPEFWPCEYCSSNAGSPPSHASIAAPRSGLSGLSAKSSYIPLESSLYNLAAVTVVPQMHETFLKQSTTRRTVLCFHSNNEEPVFTKPTIGNPEVSTQLLDAVVGRGEEKEGNGVAFAATPPHRATISGSPMLWKTLGKRKSWW